MPLHARSDLLCQACTGGVVGILGEVVDLLVVRGGLGHDGPHLRERRFLVQGRVDVHQAAIGTRHPRGDIDEACGSIDRRSVFEELGHLGACFLQSRDLLTEIDLKLFESELLLFVIVVDRTDVRQRDPELAHPPDLMESQQVGSPVLFVSVAHPFGLGEQPELVIVPNRIDRGSGQTRQFARAPSHGQVLPPMPCGSVSMRSSSTPNTAQSKRTD